MRQFKIYPSVISTQLIDEINSEHEKIKRSPFNFFRAQGYGEFERPELDKFGSQINSVHNPHLLGFFPHYTRLLKDVFFGHEITECLRDFYEFEKPVVFNHYQSMHFDKSTATALHQDTWYLDTIKNSLVGVWFALEDIEPGCGPFCLYTDTDSRIVGNSEFDFENLETDENFKKTFPTSHKFDFYPKKGDVLIWNSKLIHGAVAPEQPNLTRKSLTSHYYPAGDEVQDQLIKRWLSIYNHKNPKKTFNKNINQTTVIPPIVYQSICAVFSANRRLKNIVMSDDKMEKNLKEIRRLQN